MQAAVQRRRQDAVALLGAVRPQEPARAGRLVRRGADLGEQRELRPVLQTRARHLRVQVRAGRGASRRAPLALQGPRARHPNLLSGSPQSARSCPHVLSAVLGSLRLGRDAHCPVFELHSAGNDDASPRPDLCQVRQHERGRDRALHQGPALRGPAQDRRTGAVHHLHVSCPGEQDLAPNPVVPQERVE